MKNKTMIVVWSLVVILVAAGAVIGVDYYNKNLKSVSTVTFDVNPSVTLMTNYYDKVISVVALNDDGEEILTDLDLIGMDVTEASDAITAALMEAGYLDGDGANILLTIQNSDEDKAVALETELSTLLNTKLEDNYVAGTVLTQTSTVRENIPENIKTLMDTYDISYSKAVFITNLVALDSTLSVSELATLSINEISSMISAAGLDVSGIVGNNGNGIYQSSTTMALKRVKDAAQNASDEAARVAEELNQKAQQANQGEDSQIAAQTAAEVAQQAKAKADEALEAAQNAYEEAEALSNQGASTENQVQNQNENGTSDDTTSGNGSGSSSETSGNGSTDSGSTNGNSDNSGSSTGNGNN
ncbi:MAG: hypothetical protein PHD02_02755 [Bacilli bacterium]|nr:hypothetical protein [Bacilli bacterium]